MSHLTLINPPQVFSKTQVSAGSLPPLGPAYLSAVAVESGHEVHVVDGLGECMDQLYRFGDFTLRGLTPDRIIKGIPSQTDVIGISNIFSFSFPIVRELARMIKGRFPDRPLVLGGVHPTALPEFVLNQTEADALIIGEGEDTLLEYLRHIDGSGDMGHIRGMAFSHEGEVVINRPREPIHDLERLPFPRYDLFPIEEYISKGESHGAPRGRWITILGTRGCPYLCTFCTAPRMWGTGWRVRGHENIVDEMVHFYKAYGVRDFHFEDLTLALDKEYMRNLCEAIINRGIDISWQIPNGTRAESIDEEITGLMRSSGCTNITFAPETGSERVLRMLDKQLDLRSIEGALRSCVKAGMVTTAFFFIGYPGETAADIRRTLSFARRLARLGLDECAFATFTPLPGSRIFYTMLRRGEIELNDDFFLRLSYMGDLRRVESWNPHVSRRGLKVIRLLSYLHFFLFSFLFHPVKLIRAIIKVFSPYQDTKAQRVLRDKIHYMMFWRKRARVIMYNGKR